jgi:cytochrome b561
MPMRYTAVAKTFHWVIAGLIVTQFVLANMADDLPLGARKLALLARHKSFGMTVLMLAILRLLWRLKNPPPPLPSGMTPLERLLARGTHMAFYVLLFAMPLTGWTMSSAKNYSVSWFGLFTWPNLIGSNEQAFTFLRATHHILSDVLFVIAVLHILAALKHHFWNRDDVLKRMLPFASCTALALWAAGAADVSRAAGPAVSYVADPAASRLEFTGVQAGAEFKAVFHKFTAAVDFAPDALAGAHFDVQIDLSSVDSMDKDRDGTMRGTDVFDTARFPTAHYVTHSVSKTATGYSATGALTLHGVTKDVPIEFQFAATAGGAKLVGTARLKRLDFGVGQGDWKSTEWVADPVSVAFSLVLKPKAAS